MKLTRWVTRRLVPPLLAALGAGLLAPAAASAGGWAVVTVDEMPTPVVGVESTVSLSLRAHGRSLMDARPFTTDGDSGMQLVVTAPNGTTSATPVTMTGEPGRLEAVVRFDQAGDHRWEVRGGPFPPSALGELRITEATATSSAGGAGSSLISVMALAAAIVLAGAALVDQVVGQRQVRLA